jgi:AcrR family transcriptional regulator
VSSGQDGGPGRRGVRRDASANRERVLAAAAAVFNREGPRVPLARIAEEAGVGVATLYRNYPSREALLLALTERSYRLVLNAARRAADSDAPAIDSVGAFLDDVVERRAELVMPLVGGPAPVDAQAIELRARIQEALDRVLARGRRDGTVRDDVTSIDVIVTAALLVQGLAAHPDWDQGARRHAEIVLAGLAPAVASPLHAGGLTGASLERHFRHGAPS